MISSSREISFATRKVEENFKTWLDVSGLIEKDFLKFHSVGDFEIQEQTVDGYSVVVLGYYAKNTFIKIGEQIAYQENDLEAFEDMALLLLLMAQKLDNANAEHMPMFLKRKDYFYNKVKKFIKGEKNYKRIY